MTERFTFSVTDAGMARAFRTAVGLLHAGFTEERRKAPAFRHGDIRRIPPQGGKCLH